MGIELLTQRYDEQIAGVLSCWDRVLIFGTLPKICYAAGMTSYLYERGVRIFDYPRFAEPFRDQLRENAERLAAEAGIEIEFLRKRNVRKEDRVKEALARRGDHPGLVCIFSAMEPCSTYKPWHDKQTGRTFLKPDDGKCLRYYFYFVDEQLGLCYVRVPTWLPCRLQIYFNGHNWLANTLRRRGIDFTLLDNAPTRIADWERAQSLADDLRIQKLHRKLDEFASRFCPIHRSFGADYHWSVNQCEYATDIVFRKQADLQPLYEDLSRTAIHTVKPDNIATFLGKKLVPQFEGEMGNRLNTRIEGTRIKHTMGPVSLKLYDKFGLMLRIETTVNDMTFFKHYRETGVGGRTPRRQPRNKLGRHAENHLQPARAARTFAGRQPPGPPATGLCRWGGSAAIWSSSPRSKTGAAGATNSTSCRSRSSMRAAATPASTSLTRTTTNCSAPSLAGSSTSAGCRTRTCAAFYPERPAPRSRACSNACVCTG